ncbi:DNA repair protein RecO [candidate division NPL-UPA2 bacterium]|nr:DNA repair protein RecO [candidate division NPL-UPA2 bacterium]
MPIRKTEAIVLRSRDWSKSSKIVTFYTHLFGKVSGIAKGAMRPKNKFGGSLELFSVLTLIFYEKEGRGLQIISECMLKEPFQEIREDLSKLAYASYLVELVDRGVKGKEEAEGLFQLLFASFRLLKKGVESKLVARAFELHLLRILGYRPHLADCVSCRHKTEGNEPKLSFSLGGILCPQCGDGHKEAVNISPGILSLMRQLSRMELTKLERLKVSSNLHNDLEALLRGYITFLYEGELKSVKFLKQLSI